MIDDASSSEREFDYTTAIRSKLSDNLLDNYEFLINLYTKRKEFREKNYDSIINLPDEELSKDENLDKAMHLYNFIAQEFAALYWLRDGYFSEQTTMLYDDDVNPVQLYQFIPQESLDEITTFQSGLEEKIGNEMEKRESLSR